MPISSGRFTYEAEEGWAKIPEGHEFPDASGVTVDSDGNVYILNRGPHPVIVLDKNGNFLRSFGEGEFDQRAQEFELQYVSSSHHAEAALAEQYAGMPFEEAA